MEVAPSMLTPLGTENVSKPATPTLADHLKKLIELGIVNDCAALVCQHGEIKPLVDWAVKNCGVTCEQVEGIAYDWWKKNKTETAAIEEFLGHIFEEKDDTVFKQLLLRFVDEQRAIGIPNYTIGQNIDSLVMNKQNLSDSKQWARTMFLLTSLRLPTQKQGLLDYYLGTLTAETFTPELKKRVGAVFSAWPVEETGEFLESVSMTAETDTELAKIIVTIILNVTLANGQFKKLEPHLRKLYTLPSNDDFEAFLVEAMQKLPGGLKKNLVKRRIEDREEKEREESAVDEEEPTEESNPIQKAINEVTNESENPIITTFGENFEQTSFYGAQINIAAGLLRLLRKYQNVCLPQGKNTTIHGMSIQWNCEFTGEGGCHRKLDIPTEFEENFAKCVENQNIRFIVGDITLINDSGTPGDKSAHANAFLFDKQDKSIEIFEPNGSVVLSDSNWFDAEQFYNELEVFFIHKTQFAKKLYRPHEFCPNVSFQALQARENEDLITDPGGFCGAWSIWWIEFRLANASSTESLAELTKRAIETLQGNQKTESLTKFIRSYAESIVSYRNKLIENIYTILDQTSDGKKAIELLNEKSRDEAKKDILEKQVSKKREEILQLRQEYTEAKQNGNSEVEEKLKKAIDNLQKEFITEKNEFRTLQSKSEEKIDLRYLLSGQQPPGTEQLKNLAKDIESRTKQYKIALKTDEKEAKRLKILLESKKIQLLALKQKVAQTPKRNNNSLIDDAISTAIQRQNIWRQ